MVWLGLRLAHPNHPLRPPKNYFWSDFVTEKGLRIEFRSGPQFPDFCNRDVPSAGSMYTHWKTAPFISCVTSFSIYIVVSLY